MSIRIEFLSDPAPNLDATIVLIGFLSGPWKNYKIFKIEREESNDDIHQNGWKITHILQEDA